MKKNFLTVIATLAFGLISFSQMPTPKAINTLPSNGNGYLVLNKYNYPNVTKWNIEITDQVNGQTQTIYKRDLVGTNFDFIPTNSYSSNAQIHVIGVGRNGDVLVDETNWMNGQPPISLCYEICNGTDYVYQLTSLDIPNGGYRLKMETPYETPAGFSRYYEWFTVPHFGHPSLGPQNPNAHGLQDFAMSPGQIQDESIIQYYLNPTDQNGASQYFYNRFGDPINGNLIGVQKYFGPYWNVHSEMESDVLASDYCESFEMFQFAIDAFNDHSPDAPMELVCNGLTYGGGSTDPEVPSQSDCYETFYENLGSTAVSNDGGVTYTVWTFTQAFSAPCYEIVLPGIGNNGVSGGNGFNWPEEVAAVNFTTVANNPNDPFVTQRYVRSDYFDQNGNYSGGSFTVPKGLLRVSYNFRNGTKKDYYVFNGEANTASLTQADFVNFVAYPVPVIDNSFNFNLHANQRVTFTLELRNSNGHLIYSNRYSVAKDHDLEEVITPADGIQTGTYFCKLTFGDNSQINFQIIK